MNPFDDDNQDAELSEAQRLERAKSKLIMDFGLTPSQPERVTLEVLRQLIREKPDKITQAVRRWLRPPE